MKLVLCILIAGWALLSAMPVNAQQADVDCADLSATLNQQIDTWDYATFEANGWRKLASKECFFEAGASIVSWLNAHHASASAEQTRTLRYHAARVFAMTGRNQVALLHVSHARNPDQAEDAANDWNGYLNAFSGWLQRDITLIRTAIARLETQQIDETGYKPNLAAAKRFLTCFSLPYASIETDPACIKQPDIALGLRSSPGFE